MFDALTLPGDELRQVSKDIVNQGLRPIHSIELSLPMVMSTTDSVGTHNDELKIYAFKAYDALAGHFGSREHWGAWDIAAYYSEGDDANTSVHLGVFTQKVRNQ